MAKINIAIIGDNALSGTMELSKPELDIFKKVLAGLRADGEYAPRVLIENLDETAARRATERRKAKAARRAAMHSASREGLTAMEAAFKAAMAAKASA